MRLFLAVCAFINGAIANADTPPHEKTLNPRVRPQSDESVVADAQSLSELVELDGALEQLNSHLTPVRPVGETD